MSGSCEAHWCEACLGEDTVTLHHHGQSLFLGEVGEGHQQETPGPPGPESGGACQSPQATSNHPGSARGPGDHDRARPQHLPADVREQRFARGCGHNWRMRPASREHTRGLQSNTGPPGPRVPPRAHARVMPGPPEPTPVHRVHAHTHRSRRSPRAHTGSPIPRAHAHTAPGPVHTHAPGPPQVPQFHEHSQAPAPTGPGPAAPSTPPPGAAVEPSSRTTSALALTRRPRTTSFPQKWPDSGRRRRAPDAARAPPLPL